MTVCRLNLGDGIGESGAVMCVLLLLELAAAAEHVLLALLKVDPDPENCRRRFAEVPRTTPDKVSISFRLGQGLKKQFNKSYNSLPHKITFCNHL